MREISLDELPEYSPWPRYILENGAGIPRSAGMYDERYQRLLGFAARMRGSSNYERVRQVELEDARSCATSTPSPALPLGEVAMSSGNRLYAASLGEAMETSLSRLMTYLRPEALLTGEAVDLGCGYGYLLHRLKLLTKNKVSLRGGERSLVAVRLANLLDPDLDVVPFDFYGEDCAPLARMDIPSVVTTSYALHQLTSARPAVELLAKYRDRIDVVVNLEPEEDHFGEGLLGLLRRRYGQIHGYSADLVRVLREREDVEIQLTVPAVVGANALLPGTITVWRFK